MNTESLNYFELLFVNPYARMFLAILLTSFTLSVLNTFPTIGNGEKWYHSNNFLLLCASFFFTIFTTAVEIHSFNDFQIVVLKFFFTFLIAFIFAKSKGQELVDKFVNKVSKAIVKKDEGNEQ
ncbi:MAG: hypothetical protein H3C35_13405 [Bacteroidetes bacterium]|nr:hypothetical protein [Bacteroidota bacterium]